MQVPFKTTFEILQYINKRREQLSQDCEQFKGLEYPYSYDAGFPDGAYEEITELERFILGE